MPLKDSYAGVQNTWYVSPALFPIIISLGMMLLAILILRHAIKNNGIQLLKSVWEKTRKTPLFDEKGIRFASILVPLLTMVYVNLVRIDFYLIVAMFLSFTIPVFYFNSLKIMKKMLIIYSIAMGIILILALIGLDKMLELTFYYFMDSVSLVLLIAMNIILSRTIKREIPEQKKKWRQILLISYISPFVLIIMFKFLLRIPMPKEGAVTDLMAMVYYTLR